MFGGSAGILTGGYVAAKGFRPDRVAASGMLIGALVMLLAGLAWLPGSALPALFAMAGFASGVTQPSRDLLVRQTTPPGSTGSVYGFVYSGLDLGSILAPVYFGWLMDLRLAQWVFFSAVIVMLVTIMTVLRLPTRRPSVA
jgi:MFS family permease